MRAPGFWSNPKSAPGWPARLLTPLGAIYAAATARRVAKPAEYVAKCPVICVGNINVGGTGKTPTVIALIERLSHLSVHVVSRGYGGREQGPLRVDERRHSASDVGDEPLLISAFAPTWVAKDRAAGVRAADEDGADVILMDDGFQNPSVVKSLSIVVVDAEQGFGNERTIPAGPLREPVEAGLARCDLLVSIGPTDAQDRFALRHPDPGVPHLKAHLAPLQTGMDWQGLKVLAFAGIGRPEKFFETLRAQGAEIVHAEALDDHQPLNRSLMSRLESDAKRLGAQLVTTEKDAVRVPSEFRQRVLTLPVRLEIDDDNVLNAALRKLGLHSNN